jgi:hypothetical protein
MEYMVKLIGHAWLFASFLVLCTPLPAFDQINEQENDQEANSAERLPAVKSISKETGYVSCWKRNEKDIKSRFVRSPILVLPDGLRRAYVEVEAIALKPKDEATYAGRLCFNDSTLFVEGPGGKSIKIVYSDSPKVLEGNSIKLVDWSPDGNRLLLEAAQWEYEFEGIYTEFVIFNVESGVIAEPDLRSISAARFGKDCWSENTISGFTLGGAVVIAVRPDADETGLENGAISCVKRKTLVSIDLTQAPPKSVQTLPANSRLSQNGSFLPSRAQR